MFKFIISIIMFILWFLAAFIGNGNCMEGIFQNSSDVCFTRVKVFNNPHLLATTSLTPVYVISNGKNVSVVYSMSRTDERGQVCIPTPCSGHVNLIVETKSERAYAALPEKQALVKPVSFQLSEYRDSIIVDIEQYLNDTKDDNGPIYLEKEHCIRSAQNQQYFIFHFEGLSGKLTTNPTAKDYDYNTSWYPTFQQNSCFFKLQIQANVMSLAISAESYNKNTGYWFGTFNAPLLGNENGTTAACIEFRCPVYDSSNKRIPTTIKSQMPNGFNCIMKSLSDELKKNEIINATDASFTGVFSPDFNYGPNTGVYVDKRKNALYSCYTGKNAFESNYVMHPDVGIALKYKCI